MDAGSTPPPSLPFALAKAYGVKTVKPVQPAAAPTEAKPAGVNPAGTPAKPRAIVDVIDTLSSRQLTEKLQALVAAKVDKPAFEAVKPVAAAPGSLPFYRRPTDAIDAATEIAVGRTLDTQG